MQIDSLSKCGYEYATIVIGKHCMVRFYAYTIALRLSQFGICP